MTAQTVIADRFEIEELVGSGGMGEVYRARDKLTGGAVAVKLLHASAGQPEVQPGTTDVGDAVALAAPPGRTGLGVP